VKRLTDYADCAGCASKLAAAELDAILGDLPVATDDRVLVDYRTADDAGVYRWNDGSALVQTVDFFTPIVDDPYVFGWIAAANALSDVYAMGGSPRTALAVAAFPKDGPPADVVRTIFRGGSDALAEAKVALLGGHTVTDPEIKFGYAVTGEVTPDGVLTNAGAKVGDVLFLTKPLGTGIIVRAERFGRATKPELDGAIAVMRRFNGGPIGVAKATPGAVHACTDVTGFGLAGHASEVASASGVTVEIDAAALPVLPGAERLAAENLPCGGRANARHFRNLAVEDTVDPARHLLCLDPQTSGGLLLAVAPDRADVFAARLAEAGGDDWRGHAIGRVVARDPRGTLVRVR
jgi:selenide,water dikinase